MRLQLFSSFQSRSSIQEHGKWKWKSLSHVWLFVTPGTIYSMEFSWPEYWSGQPFPSPEDLSNPGIEPRSPTLQADSLPAEPQGSPRILEWVAYPFSRGSSWPSNQTEVSCIAGRFFTNWAIRDCPLFVLCFWKAEEVSLNDYLCKENMHS